LEKELKVAHRRAQELSERINSSPVRQNEVALETIAELLTALEELQVAQEELRRQNEELVATRAEVEAERLKYEDLFESAPDGYLVTDRNGTIRDVNNVASKMLGVERRFLQGKPLISYVDESERARFRNHLTSLSISDFSHSGLELRLCPRHIKPFDVSVSVSGVLGKNGTLTELRWTMRDITERKQVQEKIQALNEELEGKVNRRTAELERANAQKDELLEREKRARAEAEDASRVKDEFLAICSHELRAPLSAIQGWAEMLSRGSLDQATTQRAVETILRSAKTQTKIVGDLLDASRVIAGKLQLQPTAVDLVGVIEAATEIVRPTAQARRVALDTTLDPQAGVVFGDAARLQQIVWNLLSNAVKFTPAGGSVTVRLERKDERATIVVQDTGIGIKPEFLPHAFELFRQADSSTTRVFGGLGLGLAIVSHLTKSHGGSVQVESEGEGRGATFTVSLPLMRASAKAQSSAAENVGIEPELAAEGTTPLEGLRVLLVDDDKDSRGMLKTALSAYGAELKACSSSSEALEALKRWRADVLISDIGMPNEDGYDLIHKVRDLPAEGGGAIPAIALTGYASLEDKKRSLEAGYQTHMSKPVEIAKLVATVANLSRPGGQAESA
jgi:PAS domain S-box-containing protein